MPGRIVPNGAKIRELRDALGLKQADFAERCGLSDRTLRNIEKSNATVSPSKLHKIADELKTSHVELVCSSPKEASDNSNAEPHPTVANVFELSRTTSASKLLDASPYYRGECEYCVRDDITTLEADLIKELLLVLARVAHMSFHRPFEPLDPEPDTTNTYKDFFYRLHGQGRLQELIVALQAAGVNMFVGQYQFTRVDEAFTPSDRPQHKRVLRLTFSRLAVDTITEQYDQGATLNKETGQWEWHPF
jgi:transcriptional regulator with XRE-family HTH domain